ncbi:MAG TPA: hypothetical protein VL860_13705 [Planctomycetota bacterium]|nr:hypothetical protein [Planctomycetota bacterium]
MLTRRRQKPLLLGILPALLLLLAPAVGTAADLPDPGGGNYTNPIFNEQPDETDVAPGCDYAIKYLPHLGVWTSTIQRASIDFGMTWVPIRGRNQGFGLTFLGEIGTGGGKIKAGPAVTDLRSVFRRATLSAVAYWTYWNPVALPVKQTYAGLELDLVPDFYGMRFQIGVYRHIGGYDKQHDWIINAGFGFGF